MIRVLIFESIPVPEHLTPSLLTGYPVVGREGQAVEELGGPWSDQCQVTGQNSGLLPEPKLLPAVHQNSEETGAKDRVPRVPRDPVERVLLEGSDGDASYARV